MALIGSVLLFVFFTVNVAIGAFGGNAPLGDVGEMLVLLAASTVFVAAILKKEADRNSETDS
ncbi:hypothetical protein NBRC116601_03740 [Cognatishimia sp. WU-CL00825]|uniref:hypothetical protein n=1 Tax=Cognatishimia sp. WU-CL00825 TaxID=3127658 RepID=UPI00310707F0